MSVCGCQGGKNNSPVIPENPSQELAITSQQESSDSESGHYLWGYYLVKIDPDSLEYEIIPVREIMNHMNILKFLEQGPCNNCFKIAGISPGSPGTFNIDISIQHPFATPLLTGFDVRGIAMFNGSKVFPVSGLRMSDSSLGDGELLNADGYTTLYNPSTIDHGPLEGYLKGKYATATAPNATLNGFKRFISDNPANTRNAFYAGDKITVTYNVKLPSPLIFGYAVDANWVSPTNKPVKDPMTDFPISANCPEAWKIEVTDLGPGLSEAGGSTVLQVNVFDRGGKDSHSAPVIECPEIFDTTTVGVFESESADYSSWQVTVANTELAVAGDYRCLVSVVDNQNDPVGKPWMDLTAYRITLIHVSEFQNQLPVAKATAEPNPQNVNQPVNFDDDGSYDPDGGIITKYEWDWDNDGTFDEEGAHVTHSWDTPGSYQVQFRVADDEMTVDTLDSPLEIVIENDLPVAIATADPNPQTVGQPVNFDDDGSYDPDGGTLTKYEWDWDNDGTFDEVGKNITHTWDTSGNYQVQFRVTDDELQTDTLDEPLEVTITESKVPPVAIATVDTLVQEVNKPIHFLDDGSYDPDGGLITKYEWDWDNDGIYDGEGTETDHSWDTPGTYYVQFRVTDDELQTDTLDEPLEVQIVAIPGEGWARTWGGSDDDVGVGVAVDVSGNVYVTGRFYGAVDFDTGSSVDNHTSNGGYDIFLSKFDSSGNFQWARTWGGTGNDVGVDVVVDISGNFYVTGVFQATVDFDTGSGVDNHTSNGDMDIFLSKFDSSGNFQWARTWGGSGDDQGWGVAVDESGNIYVTGWFTGTVDFNPGPGVDNQTSNGWDDIFLSKFDSSGNFQWARTWGGSEDDWGIDLGVAVNVSGNVYVTGCFYDTVDFDPGSGVDNHTSNGEYDIFLSKFLPDGSW